MKRDYRLLGMLLVTLAARPSSADETTQRVLLCRVPVQVRGQSVVAECWLTHLDGRALDPTSALRDIVTLEISQPGGAGTGAAAVSLAWRLEAESLVERTLYERTLRASCAQFTEGRLRLVLSWLGACPPDHHFVRIEIYDLDLEDKGGGLGPKRAFARRTHEPLAVFQRQCRDDWPCTGDVEALMSPSVVVVRLEMTGGQVSIFEYELRQQVWSRLTGDGQEVTGEAPFAGPEYYWMYHEPSPPGAPAPSPPRGFAAPVPGQRP